MSRKLKASDFEIPESVLEDWQEIIDLLAEILHIPVALIMRYKNPEIEVFRSSNTTNNPYTIGDSEILQGSGLYCERVVSSQKPLKVINALKDPHWDKNPDIKLNMISYLGLPLNLPDHIPFGTLCVLDRKENSYSENTEELLHRFKNILESHLEIIYTSKILGDKYKSLSDYLEEIQLLRGIVPICSNCKSIRDEQGHWSPVEKWFIRNPKMELTHGLCPTCYEKLYGAEDASSS